MDNQFEYRKDLDSLHFTPEQKATLTARVAQAAAGEGSRTARRPVRRTLVLAAAAAIVLALGVGAGATVLHLASDSFAPIFGTAQTEIIDKIGCPIDASDTVNGVTISADAIMGDKYNACIIYSITNADGTPLTLPEGVEAGQVMPGQQSAGALLRGGGNSSAWNAIDPETGILQYVESMSSNEPLKLGNTTATFENLYFGDDESQERLLLTEGTWKMKFEVNYEDSSVSVPAGQTFTRDSLGFTIDEITISPLAVQVHYSTDASPDWGDEEDENGRMTAGMEQEQNRFLGLPLLLTLSDGSILDLGERSGGSISPTESGAECTKGTVFDQIIPLENMVSLTVGDVVIPVNAN